MSPLIVLQSGGQGLAALVASQLGRALDKRLQCSSWGLRPLSSEQVPPPLLIITAVPCPAQPLRCIPFPRCCRLPSPMLRDQPLSLSAVLPLRAHPACPQHRTVCCGQACRMQHLLCLDLVLL